MGMAKEGVLEYKRFQQDKLTNNLMCTVLDTSSGSEVPTHTKWSELKVGQLIIVAAGEAVPADLVLLASSEQGGEAYCSTANLDGERTLKPR